MSAGSDSEDDAILRPRGRLAARLQAQNTETNDASSATERESGSDDDADIVTIRPRKKLQQRRQRSTTPQPRPQQDKASPSPFVSPEKSAPASPGLFVSPSKPSAAGPASEEDDSDDDLPSVGSLAKNKRFLALVAKKKQEREAREAEEAQKQAERAERLAAQQQEDMSMVDDEDDNITDDDGGRKLTQGASRPSARKASKKALEEMSRETQRLTRSLQLTHEAKVKKKITKSALFERFNFKPEGAAEPTKVVSSRATTPGSGLQTDAEMKETETPPSSTSPPHSAKGDAPEAQNAGAEPLEHVLEENSDGELLNLEDIRSRAAAPKVDKGKGKAKAADFEAEDREKVQQQKPKRNIRVKLPDLHVNHAKIQLDEDDDLDIQPSHKNKMDAIFNRVPVNQAKESRPMYMLRILAQVDDPEKKPAAASSKRTKLQKDQPPPMTIGELQQSLFQRSRAQAKLERDRHLEMLRSKGIHVPTAEEREREEAEIEDLVARAKREAEEIMDREREAAKQDRKASKAAGEEDPLGWDDSDESGDDYVEEEEEPAELELSGSEDEEGEGMDIDEEEEVEFAGLLIDDAADSAEESEGGDAEEPTGDQDSDEDGVSTAKQPTRRRQRKQVAVLSDDEEEVEQTPRIVEATPRPKANFFKSPRALNTGSPSVPTSVLRSATKTFIPGLPVAGAAGLGLTQIFAGTMDDSQMGSAPEFGSPSQPRPTFDVIDLPDSNFSQTAVEISPDIIMDSQPAGRTQDPETQGVQFNFAQSQALGFDTLLRDSQQDASQVSLIEPTQDGGYQDFSPLVRRFVEAPASTVETVKLHESQGDASENQSPLVKRTGRLRRRADLVSAAADSDSEAGVQDAVDADETDEFGFGTVKPAARPSAFNVMQDAAVKKKVAEAFDKKKSKARDMVQDQAEESEDEYAGLGGVDGEDSDDDDAQSVKEMIDDETKQDETDERKTAAFYADRERAADEKQVEKLFHDITTGMLRRKRGGDWDDLDDDDDGGEARRRLKRRQFAKMQRALFSDERISKVAENPRNQAFLKTIEDAGSDDDMDFLFAPPPRAPGLDSQDSQASDTSTTPAAAVTIPDSQPHAAPANNPRRTKMKPPSNIGDIRHSLSNLLDEPLNSSSSFSVIPATDLDSNSGSDDDDDEPTPTTTAPTTATKEKENRNPRRRPAAVVVDRISLKRNSSSSTASTTSSTTTNRQAFTITTSSTGGFKVPALLRRATTNSLISSSSTTASSTGVTTDTGAGAGPAKIKKSAGKRSGISYLARENERRAAVSEMEARREAKKWKGAEGRGKVVGGLFGGGKFE
ncbi:MRC1-like domain-containing protein [Schizothecium vesticola]|uniref:MRC1-like domain-containing protein n=1 Tax=Schizothecium vesticola TaxID=314040 RepID=A0AA40FBZ6_9PEZI|nr:MRC1-like domain-containing protein [Schizothecium vesticola]